MDLEAQIEALRVCHNVAVGERPTTFFLSSIDRQETSHLQKMIPKDLYRPWFAALGMDVNVPVFLRANGRVKNMSLTQDAVLRMTTRFLNEAVLTDAVAEEGSIQDAFNTWLVRENSADPASLGYSIVAALHAFSYEARCTVIRDILLGTVDVELWKMSMTTIDRLRDNFIRCAGSDLRISKRAALGILERYFSVWEEAAIGQSFRALCRDHVGDGINVMNLFARDLASPESNLVSTIRELFFSDWCRWLRDLESTILEDPSVASGQVTIHSFLRALSVVDPHRPDTEMIRCLVNVFGDVATENIPLFDADLPLQDRFMHCVASLPLEQCIVRLQQCTTARFSRRSLALAKKVTDLQQQRGASHLSGRFDLLRLDANDALTPPHHS